MREQKEPETRIETPLKTADVAMLGIPATDASRVYCVGDMSPNS